MEQTAQRWDTEVLSWMLGAVAETDSDRMTPVQVVGARMAVKLQAMIEREIGVSPEARDMRLTDTSIDPAVPTMIHYVMRWRPVGCDIELLGGPRDGEVVQRTEREPGDNGFPHASLNVAVERGAPDLQPVDPGPDAGGTPTVCYQIGGWDPGRRRWIYTPVGHR